jgi:hypothetical protein
MTQETFEVTSYKLRIEHRIRNNAHSFERVLDIDGKPLHHGTPIPKALFNFATAFNDWQHPTVGNVLFNAAGEIPGPAKLVGYFGDQEFDLFYKILQEEKPLYVFYERPAGPRTSSYACTMVGLGSSTEPVGEGPRDF